MPARFRRLRLFLLRWHRRFGVVLSLLLIWLALTGIALNHSVDWGLDHSAAPSLLQLPYRGSALEFRHYRVAGHWVSHNGASTLYLDGARVGYCERPFGGATDHGGEIIAACGDSLQWLDGSGQVLESIDIGYELPGPVSALASDDDALVLSVERGSYHLDLDTLELSPRDAADGEPAWSTPTRPGRALLDQLERESYGEGVSWERALLDLHSGKFFGTGGALVADLVALGLLLLAVSGVWVWSTKPGRWRRPR